MIPPEPPSAKRNYGSPVAKMKRGFGTLLAPGIARTLFIEASTALLKRDPPKTIKDVYAMMPPTALFPEPMFPTFMAPAIELLEQACTVETRWTFHTPPRHGKSNLIRMALLYYHYNHPGRFHCYVTYDSKIAISQMREMKWLLRQMGISHHSNGDELYIEGGHLENGTTVKFTSVSCHITGFTITGVMFLDDPISGADKANSPTARDKVWAWVETEMLGRKMRFMSVMAVMTRWGADDVIGRLNDKYKWHYLRLPMLCDNPVTDPLKRKLNAPLWPELFPYEECIKMRTQLDSGKVWHSQFQGDPTPESDIVFKPNRKTYDRLPPETQLVWSIGIDPAYGGNKNNDWSVAYRIAQDVTTGVCYIDKVIRRQCKLHEFAEDLMAFYNEKPCPVTWIYGGTEGGIGDLLTSNLMRDKFPKFNMIFATQGKYYRAIDTATAWNADMLLAPVVTMRNAKMIVSLNNVLQFTGVDDPHDDDVDALVSAFEPFKNPANKHIPTLSLQPVTTEQELAKRIMSDTQRRRNAIMSPKRRF